MFSNSSPKSWYILLIRVRMALSCSAGVSPVMSFLLDPAIICALSPPTRT